MYLKFLMVLFLLGVQLDSAVSFVAFSYSTSSIELMILVKGALGGISIFAAFFLCLLRGCLKNRKFKIFVDWHHFLWPRNAQKLGI